MGRINMLTFCADLGLVIKYAISISKSELAYILQSFHDRCVFVTELYIHLRRQEQLKWKYVWILLPMQNDLLEPDQL